MQERLNGKLKSKRVAISFDTTGSMASCIEQVRQHLSELVASLAKDIPDIQIALIAHGDYCDGENCIRMQDFTADLDELLDFIRSAPNTSGGDFAECYELVLNYAKRLAWPETGGSLIMIGDAVPHIPGEVVVPSYGSGQPMIPDWRAEANELIAAKINIFAMQCLNHPVSKPFWEELAKLSDTPHINLYEFDDAAATIGAVAYAAGGSETMDTYIAARQVGKTSYLRCSTEHFNDTLNCLSAYSKREE